MIFRARARSRWWTPELRPGIPAKVDYAWNAALQVGSNGSMSFRYASARFQVPEILQSACMVKAVLVPLPGKHLNKPRHVRWGTGVLSRTAPQAQATRMAHSQRLVVGASARILPSSVAVLPWSSVVLVRSWACLLLWCLLVLASGCTWPIESRRVEVFAEDQQLNITRQDRGVLG